MIVNNFKCLSPYLNFGSDEDFYYLQIIKRRKDNPDLNRSEKTIKNYYLFKGDLERKKEDIIKYCDNNHARAYLYLNKRNIKDVAYDLNLLLAGYLKSKTYKAIQSIFDKAVGNSHSNKDKLWLVDIDTFDQSEVDKYIIKIGESMESNWICEQIPTRNGYHIITKPFNTNKFLQLCAIDQLPNVEIHKDNPTLLYFNDK